MEIVKFGAIRMVSKGKNGIGFQLRLSKDVNPFKTFMIKSAKQSVTSDGTKVVS